MEKDLDYFIKDKSYRPEQIDKAGYRQLLTTRILNEFRFLQKFEIFK